MRILPESPFHPLSGDYLQSFPPSTVDPSALWQPVMEDAVNRALRPDFATLPPLHRGAGTHRASAVPLPRSALLTGRVGVEKITGRLGAALAAGCPALSASLQSAPLGIHCVRRVCPCPCPRSFPFSVSAEVAADSVMLDQWVLNPDGSLARVMHFIADYAVYSAPPPTLWLPRPRPPARSAPRSGAARASCVGVTRCSCCNQSCSRGVAWLLLRALR